MRAEQLCQWIYEVMREKEPCATHWLKLVAIVQAEIHNGNHANNSTWQMVVLIPKRDDIDLWGIDLIEVLFNTVTGLLNRCFTLVIQFHDVLYAFWVGCGTGNTALKAKMLQNITAIREAVLYEILLYLHKVFATLDRDRCLDIIAVYGVGPRALCLLWTY